jgi:hypothetical protein
MLLLRGMCVSCHRSPVARIWRAECCCIWLAQASTATAAAGLTSHNGPCVVRFLILLLLLLPPPLLLASTPGRCSCCRLTQAGVQLRDPDARGAQLLRVVR